MSSQEERAAASRNTQARLAGYQQRKTQIEPAYLKAREYVKTPEYQQQRDQALASITRIVNVINRKGMDSTQAVLALGQIIQVLEPLSAAVAPIVEFESVQKSLGELGKLEETLTA